MEPKREPKWSPKASQDGTKKEKKSEVKLRELSEALGAKKRNERRSDPISYEAAGGGRGDQDPPKTPPGHPTLYNVDLLLLASGGNLVVTWL